MDAESILKGLNGDQRSAVLHDHKQNGALLILAGAGSGKTSVLTKRIQYRIMSGVLPEKILALTFTAKAAAEMRERVEALFPKAGVRLCTFHSLALFMLKQKIGGQFAYEILGFNRVPTPKETENREFLRELVRLKIPATRLNREELFSGDLPNALKKKIRPLQKNVILSGNVVFEDLIYLAIRLLETSIDAREYFQSLWSEILVDEYQDINPSQYRLVKNILGNRNDLFVVGDDDQAIYGFRGADIGNIRRFQEDFKDSTLIRLEWNYRSVPNVLHLANEIFTNKPVALRKVLRAGNPKGSGGNRIFTENRKPEVWVSDNPIEEAEKIRGAILSLRQEYGLLWKNFAILVRYNRQRQYFEKLLREGELPIAGDHLAGDQVLEDGIHIETVHASKGLQYAVVFYAGLAEGFTPGKCEGSRKQRKAQMEEERRLYYVGVTRAESYLVLLYCKQRYWKGKLLKLKPSRFLPHKQPQPRWTMPVILFRTYVVIVVLSYMLAHILALPFILIACGKNFNTWFEGKIQKFSRFCMNVLRIDLEIENQANLAKVDWNRPVFVMGNHNSYADIPVVFLSIERIVGFIAKASLRFIPFLNFWMHKIGCIFINRKKGGGATLIREAIESGRTPRICLFPEGTRGKNDSLSPFKSGGFRLALESQAIVLPIVIRGTSAVWERRKDTGRCKVTVQILDPIDAGEIEKRQGDNDPRKELMPLVRSRMEAAL